MLSKILNFWEKYFRYEVEGLENIPRKGGVLLAMRENGDFQNFKTEKASRGDIRSTVTATGTVNPVKTVLVGTQVSGTIKTLHVDFNSFVKDIDKLDRQPNLNF